MATEQTIRNVLTELAALVPREIADDKKRSLLRVWMRHFRATRDELLIAAADMLIEKRSYASIPTPGDVQRVLKSEEIRSLASRLAILDALNWSQMIGIVSMAADGDRACELWLDQRSTTLDVKSYTKEEIAALESAAEKSLASIDFDERLKELRE